MKKSVIISLLIGILLISVISVSLVSAGLLEDAWNRITGRAVDNGTEVGNETEPEPEPEPETCAASITADFNQDVYHEGDLFELTVEVFDSQGNRIPNVLFYISTYLYSEDRWGSPSGSETTNEQGYHEHSDSSLRIVETGKFLYKFYTEETESCSSVEDTAEIEFIKEETEEEAGEEEAGPEPESEPDPLVCAAKIVITFDKEVYYVGDYIHLTQVILDSEGNPIPHYRFYIMHYNYANNEWEGAGSTSVGPDGYTRPKFKVEEGTFDLDIGKTKSKVYTKQIGSCDSVEASFELELRRREPVPCGIGSCVPEEEEEVEEIPEEKIFYKCNGCELEDKCYPMGYRKEGKYCSDNNEFVNQMSGKCDNNFECKSNVCISGECVEEGLMRRIIKWFKRLFGAGDEDEKPGDKICRKLLIEKDIGEYKYFMSEYGKREEHQVGLFSEDGEQIGIVKCCVAGYKNPDGTEGKAGIVCPFDNEKDAENAIRGLLNNGDIVLGEYKGQKLYRRFDKPEEIPEVIVWTNDAYLVASGVGPGEGQLSEEIADAYLKKYPNDLA